MAKRGPDSKVGGYDLAARISAYCQKYNVLVDEKAFLSEAVSLYAGAGDIAQFFTKAMFPGPEQEKLFAAIVDEKNRDVAKKMVLELYNDFRNRKSK